MARGPPPTTKTPITRFPMVVAERRDYGIGRPQLACLYEYDSNHVPFRGGKWGVPWLVYPYKEYPVFCKGGMYVASMRTVALIWEVSRTAPVLAFDDVWITGILRYRAGIAVSDIADWKGVAEHYGPTVPERTQNIMEVEWRKLWFRTIVNTANKICKVTL